MDQQDIFDKTINPVLPRLALIAGATASGKSGLAVSLAKKLESAGRRSVIINADSAQVYRELQVLSARPNQDEMQGIPHRLFGYRDGSAICSAADWAKDAKAEIALAHEANAIPILVGGTGLYLRSLIDGIAPIPGIDPTIRQQVRAMPVTDAYTALEKEDSDSAARLNANDVTRISRALEIIRSTGKPIAYWQQLTHGGIGESVNLAPLILLPPRDELYARCDLRFASMLEYGAISEVTHLLKCQLPERAPVMQAIGVAEIRAFLEGQLTRAEMIAAGQQATRRYAKRQYTWFRNQPPRHWPRIDMTNNDEIDSYFDILLQN